MGAWTQACRKPVGEGIVIATVETEERAKDHIWRLTSGTYSCFAVLEDGTVIDEFGSYPKLLEVGE